MNTSIYFPDELVDEFDDVISEKKAMDDLDNKVSRSEVIRMLMREYVKEHRESEPDFRTLAAAD